MPKSYDVIVVGAGPAGSAAAQRAAAGGARVLLLERRRQVGLPVRCAEFVPAHLPELVELPVAAIAQRIEGLVTHIPGEEPVYLRAPGYTLHREIFDHHLAATAARAGADLRLGSPVVRPTEAGVVVEKEGRAEAYRGEVIIGADGPRSTVGRWLGSENQVLAVSLQAEVELRENSARTEVYFEPAFGGGYGWLFPKGATANVGLGLNPYLAKDLSAGLQHLFARLGPRIDAGKVHSLTGGPIPVGGPVVLTVGGRYLLAGDAGGFTDPLTGAGIYNAVLTGQFAAESALAALGGDGMVALSRYRERWEEALGPSLGWASRRREVRDREWLSSRDFASLIRHSWLTFPEYQHGRREWSLVN